MALQVRRGHEALRRGRWSRAGAEYFVTCCTEMRVRGLEVGDVTSALIAAAGELAKEEVWNLRTGVVMPDHVHLLVELGQRASLGKALRLFKGRTSIVLRSNRVRWQRGYFDHRMRDSEDHLPVFRYIYLNPYRAGLVRRQQTWAGYFCCQEDWAWFRDMTDEEMPFPEWLL